MIKSKSNVNRSDLSDTDSSDQSASTIKPDHHCTGAKSDSSEQIGSSARAPDTSYAISWTNIFYEVDDPNSSANSLLNKFFKKNKFKDDAHSAPVHHNVHIVERHRARIEIVNSLNHRTLHIDEKNETIQRINRGPCKKTILNRVSGSLRSGQILALIGPSGVGKSTLLEILSGRRTRNVTGEVYLHTSKEQHLKNCKLNKLSFIPQNDTHIENLTVKETLIYASKLKNNERVNELVKQGLAFSQDTNSTDSNTTISLPNTSPTNSSIDTIYSEETSNSSSSSLSHSPSRRHCNLAVNQLDQECTHPANSRPRVHPHHLATSDTLEVTMINDKPSPTILLNFTNVDQYHEYLVNEIIGELMLDNCAETFVSKCSGGQIKRLSIALELLSQPKVIIMDEPTTGLDFSSALNCIQILKNLTINNFDPPAIIVSIHQPSSSVVKLFDKLYVLAKGGNCIYNGYTVNMVNHLEKFHFQCPYHFNPTDLLIQISSGEFGEQFIAMSSGKFDEKCFQEMIAYQSLVTQQECAKDTSALQYKYDLSRLIEDIEVRKPNIGNQIRLLIERDIKNSSRRPLLNILRFCYFSFFAFFIYFTYNYDIGSFNGCYSELLNTSDHLNQMNYAQRLAKLSDNSRILFFITMFLVISSIMPAALTFPVEITIFIKERSNNWYGVLTYYIAKFIGDLPSYVVFPVLFTSLFYPLTHQIESTSRFVWFNVIVILNSLITRSIGMVIGSLFLNDTLSSVFVSTCAIFPFMLTAGFLIRQSVSTWILRPFWYFGFIRYTFGCLLIIIYGWGRCVMPNLATNQAGSSTTSDASENQLIDNLALNGIKSLMSNYLKSNEMKCLIQENQNGNFSLFTDLISECDINMNQIKSSMMSNLTLANLEKYDHSFILNYFELTNDHFPNYVLNLVLIFVALTFINYWILLYKVKKC